MGTCAEIRVRVLKLGHSNWEKPQPACKQSQASSWKTIKTESHPCVPQVGKSVQRSRPNCRKAERVSKKVSKHVRSNCAMCRNQLAQKLALARSTVELSAPLLHTDA